MADERWRLAGIDLVDVTLRTGATVRCAKRGSVLVPLGNVEVYAMGKVATRDEPELRRLQAFKQTRRKEFDSDPENEARLARFKRDRHNHERSREIFAFIDAVGMSESFEDVRTLVQALLAVGEGVTPDSPRARPTEVGGRAAG